MPATEETSRHIYSVCLCADMTGYSTNETGQTGVPSVKARLEAVELDGTGKIANLHSPVSRHEAGPGWIMLGANSLEATQDRQASQEKGRLLSPNLDVRRL
jgi:hypothetical protein